MSSSRAHHLLVIPTVRCLLAPMMPLESTLEEGMGALSLTSPKSVLLRQKPFFPLRDCAGFFAHPQEPLVSRKE